MQAWLPFGVRGGFGAVSPFLAFALGVGAASIVWAVMVLPAVSRLQTASSALHKSSAELVSRSESLSKVSQSLASDFERLCAAEQKPHQRSE